MSLHPAVAFGAALIGGALGGLLFAFLALPAAGVIQSMVKLWGRRYDVVETELTTHDQPVVVPEKPKRSLPWRRGDAGDEPDEPDEPDSPRPRRRGRVTRTITLDQARRAAVVAQQLSSPRPPDVARDGAAPLDAPDGPDLGGRAHRAPRVVLAARSLVPAGGRSSGPCGSTARCSSTAPTSCPSTTSRSTRPRCAATRRGRSTPGTSGCAGSSRRTPSFRRHILRRLRDEGPLLTRDVENRTKLEWRTGGWNDGDGSVGMMLEMMWARGDIMIVGRQGGDRMWDLAERRLPTVATMPAAQRVREVVARELAAAGVVKPARLGWLFDGLQVDGWQRAVARLVRDGTAIETSIDGVKGAWIAHAASLEAPFRGRTVALSPFDQLVHDRSRLEALWGFEYRLEIYVPKAKRRWGYFVLPVLRGDRLVGRFDPRFERDARILRINAVHAEEGERDGDARAVRRAIDELARWLRAVDVTYTGAMPRAWRRTLTT